MDRIIGVHFPANSNAQAAEAVGIEIEIAKKNNITVVESNTNKRYRVKSYDEATNFSMAEEMEDVPTKTGSGKVQSAEKQRDLLTSELFELKNLWFVFNKKINSVLTILPQEVLNRYDMVSKTLQVPVFDLARYPQADPTAPSGTPTSSASAGDLELIFDEVVYKMAQYYFSVF